MAARTAVKPLGRSGGDSPKTKRLWASITEFIVVAERQDASVEELDVVGRQCATVLLEMSDYSGIWATQLYQSLLSLNNRNGTHVFSTLTKTIPIAPSAEFYRLIRPWAKTWPGRLEEIYDGVFDILCKSKATLKYKCESLMELYKWGPADDDADIELRELVLDSLDTVLAMSDGTTPTYEDGVAVAGLVCHLRQDRDFKAFSDHVMLLGVHTPFLLGFLFQLLRLAVANGVLQQELKAAYTEVSEKMIDTIVLTKIGGSANGKVDVIKSYIFPTMIDHLIQLHMWSQLDAFVHRIAVGVERVKESDFRDVYLGLVGMLHEISSRHRLDNSDRFQALSYQILFWYLVRCVGHKPPNYKCVYQRPLDPCCSRCDEMSVFLEDPNNRIHCDVLQIGDIGIAHHLSEKLNKTPCSIEISHCVTEIRLTVKKPNPGVAQYQAWNKRMKEAQSTLSSINGIAELLGANFPTIFAMSHIQFPGAAGLGQGTPFRTINGIGAQGPAIPAIYQPNFQNRPVNAIPGGGGSEPSNFGPRKRKSWDMIGHVSNNEHSPRSMPRRILAAPPSAQPQHRSRSYNENIPRPTSGVVRKLTWLKPSTSGSGSGNSPLGRRISSNADNIRPPVHNTLRVHPMVTTTSTTPTTTISPCPIKTGILPDKTPQIQPRVTPTATALLLPYSAKTGKVLPGWRGPAPAHGKMMKWNGRPLVDLTDISAYIG